MGARRWAAVATAAAALAALAFACDPFHSDGPATAAKGDGATSSSSSGGTETPPRDDAGGPTGPDGGEATPDAGDGTECFEFTTGNLNGFTATGSNVKRQNDGVFIVVQGSTFNMIQRTFHRDGGIAKTRVGLDMSISGTAPTGGQYVDTLVFYYGLPADYLKTPQTAFELVDKGLNIDVWGAAATSPYTELTLDATTLPYGQTTDYVWIDSTWSNAGNHTFSVGTKQIASFDAKLANGTKNDFTIRLGGEGFNSAPALTIAIRHLCVLVR